MTMRQLRTGLMALVLLATPFAATVAAPAEPAATALMFDAAHLAKTKAGDRLTYNFKREVSDPKLVGEAFEDKISVSVDKEEDGGTREVGVNVFTGERGRPEQKISGMTGNPVLVVFLDRSVNNIASLAGGSRPFLKQLVKQSFANGAKVEPVEVVFQGKPVKGHRIRVTPFAGHKDSLKMMGYDGSTLEVVVSETVPGHFVRFASHFESPQKGSPVLDESTTLDGVGEIK